MSTSTSTSTSTPFKQGLLKRNPNLTSQEFSDHWYKHGLLVVPFFLHMDVETYNQIHAPLTTTSPDLDLATYDGAAETTLTPRLYAALTNPAAVPKWVLAYYNEVILSDEKEFLVSLAREHILQVEEGTVEGTRREIIKGGKVADGVEVPGWVWDKWRRFEGKVVEGAFEMA